ncbi:hypothetical protein FHX56_002952 [Paraburkholderia tropica]|nr:hypothetical protein [Paraburkholderia tropica]
MGEMGEMSRGAGFVIFRGFVFRRCFAIVGSMGCAGEGCGRVWIARIAAQPGSVEGLPEKQKAQPVKAGLFA